MFYSHTNLRQLFAGRVTRIVISCLLFLLVSPAVLHAQQNNRPHYQLLWRIDGPGISTPSYLFGTMHLTDKRVFEFSDSVLIALRNASSFAMEVDLDSMVAYMLSPGGPLLDTTNYMRRVLNKEEYQYVDSLVIEKTTMPIEKLNLKQMWFIEKLLLNDEEGLNKKNGANQKTENIFLDGWMHQKATGLNKPIHSLERIQNQLHFMSADASALQKEVFLWSLGYHDSGNGDAKEKTDRFNARVTSLDSLVNLYYKADLQKISKLVDTWQEDERGPDVATRNHEMADNLALLINKGSVFAAVGVAHLPGEEGMLSLLRAKGYAVTPVNASFTGLAKRERQRMDSLKGYSLNKIVDGYSITLPGTPIAYPIPNLNRKMYIGTNNIETCFAFSLDVPQLGADQGDLVNKMITNMAAQSNAVLQKHYPITYRNTPGTEAQMLQGEIPFYLRLFVRNNRAFIFMHTTTEKDSTSRTDFFNSLRFYDIVRPVTKYDTLYRPQLGFSAIIPSDANYLKNDSKETVRPEEVYSGLDNANNISYVLRIQKMQNGFYNPDDKKILEDYRTLLLQQDSTLQLIDSTITEREGLPLYQLVYRDANGFISRLHLIPRANYTYSLFCMYDGTRTDSSYWKRFFDGFHTLPLQTLAPTVSFTPADSSFVISGPATFTSVTTSDYDAAAPVNVTYYKSMDSTSLSMYLAIVHKYSPYYHNEPDSLLKSFLHPEDSSFVITHHSKSVWEGLPVYETEIKSRGTALRWNRKVIIAGHTVYFLSAIIPEEVAQMNYAQQFLASFQPGSREKADTIRLQQKKLPILLADLQSSDAAIFNRASKYLDNLNPDSTGKKVIIEALAKPFPADTGNSNAKIQLLLSLGDLGGEDVVHAAEQLFAATMDAKNQESILRFLSGLGSDTAVRTFLRLAPQVPENSMTGSNIFAYSFKRDSLYKKYIPAMVSIAAQSSSFLQAFTIYTAADSLWLAPQFKQYGLENLLPEAIQLFERQLKAWKNRQADDENEWILESRLLNTGEILALPGMPATTTASFRQLLADTTMSVRALGARALINQGIQVPDKTLNSILKDYSVAYPFIKAVNDDKKLVRIRHLLTQELVGRCYTAYAMSDDYEVTAIEQVTRIKVPQEKQPTEGIILYRFKTDESEDWEYVLNGPFPQDPAKHNLKPYLLSWVDKSIVKDKKLLSAEAVKAYKEYLETYRKED